MNLAFIAPTCNAIDARVKRVVVAEALLRAGMRRAEVREVIIRRFGVSRRTAYLAINIALNERPAAWST